MQHCTNPGCPHRLAVGVAAEFDDDARAACSDCGAPLAAGAAARPDEDLPATPAGLTGRAAVTVLGPLALVGLALLVPLPMPADGFVELRFDAVRASRPPGLLDLGLAPALVAVGALDIVRRLLTRRAVTPSRAWSGWRFAPLLAALLAALGAWWLAESLTLFRGAAPRALIALTLVAGLALQLGAARVIGARGLAPGLGLVLVVVPLRYLAGRLADVQLQRMPLAAFLVALAGVVAVVVATWWVATAHRRLRVAAVRGEARRDDAGPYRVREAGKGVRMPDVRLPIGGLLPLVLGAAWITLDNIAEYGLLSFLHERTSTSPMLLAMGAVPLFALAVAALAFRPAHRAERWAQASGDSPSPELQAWLRSLWKPALLRSVAWSGALALLVVAADLPLSVVLAAVVTTGAVLDAAAEWRMRRRAPELVAVSVCDDVEEADALVAALGRHDVDAHPRGLHARALLGLVGGFAPVEVLVPAADEPQARRVLEELQRQPRRADPHGAPDVDGSEPADAAPGDAPVPVHQPAQS